MQLWYCANKYLYVDVQWQKQKEGKKYFDSVEEQKKACKFWNRCRGDGNTYERYKK